jgi:hypothetical protein
VEIKTGDCILITERHIEHGLQDVVGKVGVITYISRYDIRFTIDTYRSYYWMPLRDVILASDLVKALS